MLQLHKNSGSARTAFENIRYFLSRGYEVHVASLTMDKDLISSMGATPHKLLPFLKSTGLYRRKWYDWQVQRLRKKLKPTITLGHGDILEQDVLTLHNCVFLASELIHGKKLDPKHEMALTHGTILRKHAFKKMIANSELMKNDTIQRFKIPADEIHVVYPSVDTSVFHPRPEQKNELRAKFNFPDKVIVSLVTSGNFKKRGLDVFNSALKLLEPKVRNLASFRVVGKVDPVLGDSPYIIFDPPMDKIEQYYNAIDIFVLPARIEEFGRVVLEAMASGLPVITTDKVGAAELIEGEARDYITPTENSQALADALTELILDPELRARLGELNAKSALKEAESLLFQKFDKVFSE